MNLKKNAKLGALDKTSDRWTVCFNCNLTHLREEMKELKKE